MFGTSGVRGPVGDVVTADLALSIGRAVASTGPGRVVVGRDPRTSGPLLVDAVAAGLRECGADVVDVGMAATPTVARAIASEDAAAGVSVTASHNPPADNGLKLWTPSGQAFDTEAQEEIERVVEADAYDLVSWDELGERSTCGGARAAHVEALCDAVDVEDPPAVVLDVGNGAGGLTADALYELGCDVETLNAQPDGRFPARPSEPTAETLASLCATVAATDVDLGVAHDGDADRMMAVDERGRFVAGDVLLALFAVDASEAGSTVAAPVDTSLAVDDALADVGASVTRTRVGDVYVAERARVTDVSFGGEPSGAWIWPDETLCPDGPLAACKLAELVGRRGSLAALVDGVDTYPIRRTSLEFDAHRERMARVAALARDRYDEADIASLDGVRIDRGEGWILVRASGTQPLIRVTAEARTDERADDLFAGGTALVEDAD